MPAELLGDPVGISCAFSDGRRSRHVVVTPDPLPLVRDLLTGLAGLVHPHGPVDAPGTSPIIWPGCGTWPGSCAHGGLAAAQAR